MREDLGFFHKHTNGRTIGFGVGAGGINRGLFDNTIGNWLLYLNSDNDAILQGRRVYLRANNGDPDIRGVILENGEFWNKNSLIIDRGNSGEGSVSISRTDYSNSIRIYAGANNNGNMAFGVESVGGKTHADAKMDLTPSALYPRTNGGLTLGTSSLRWGQIYSTSSSISTSDRNKKEDIEDYTEEYETFFDNLKPVKFRFKGNEHDRIHTGFISQDVESALKNAGLTAMDFAGFCKDQKKIHNVERNENGEEIKNEFIEQYDEDNNPIYEYSLRYEDFISLNTWQIQKLKQEVKNLKEEIEKLKNK